MNDTSVLHLGRALHCYVVSYGSIRVAPSGVFEAFELHIPGLSTRCECLAHRLDHGVTPCTSCTLTPRRTAVAAKIPIPT